MAKKDKIESKEQQTVQDLDKTDLKNEEQRSIEINNIEEVKTANKKHQQQIKTQKSAENSAGADNDHDDLNDKKNEYEKSLEKDINRLEEQLLKEKQDLETKNADYLKLYAEFDNYRKRTQQEKDEFAQYASGNVIRDLLPVLDSFDQANMSLDKEEVNIKDLRDGFSLIYKQLSTLLNDLNVKRIETVGKKFDPFYHEAVAQTEESDQEEGTIVQEFRSGYMMKDKVLRHAMVVVAK